MNPAGRALAALLAAIALAGAAGCGSDGEEPAATAPAFDAARYEGTYRGTWTNGDTGASGPVSIAIDVDDRDRTADLVIDFGGDYLGLGDPPPARLRGTYDDRRAVARGRSVLFGRYDVTIAGDGAIVGLMEDVGLGVVPRLEYTGRLTADRLDADYSATMRDGSVSRAILRMRKV